MKIVVVVVLAGMIELLSVASVVGVKIIVVVVLAGMIELLSVASVVGGGMAVELPKSVEVVLAKVMAAIMKYKMYSYKQVMM